MRFEHEIVIEAPFEKVRDFLDDVPAVARCLPGLEQIQAAGDGVYEGSVRVKIGPLGLNLSGRATVEREAGLDGWRLQGEGRDGRAGAGARASLEARLEELAPARTRVTLVADIQFSGRLAELGQPLIRRKADSLVEEFAENLRQAVEA